MGPYNDVTPDQPIRFESKKKMQAKGLIKRRGSLGESDPNLV